MVSLTAPIVTAIIPVYNGREHLAQAISGVLAQSVSDLELIVVDDGSTDGSLELARTLVSHDPRATVLTFDNGGVAVARNRGLELARGSYVAFLDQDDLWYPNKVARQLSILEEHNELAVVGCLMDYVGQRGQRLARTSQTPDPIDRQAIRRALLLPFPLSAALFRTEVLRASGGSRDYFGKGLATAADLELMAAAAHSGGVFCVREPLGGYRIHRKSVTARSHRTQIAAALYLQAVLAEPGFEKHTPWASFEQSYHPNRLVRRMTRVIFHYRQAGLEALDHRWVHAAAHLASAAAMSPTYTLKRLFRQLRGR